MPLWLAAAPLMLASRSAVRRILLEAAGMPVETGPADIDERGVEAGAPLQAPVAIAALLAREKASVIAGRNRGRLILGADQTLSSVAIRVRHPPMARVSPNLSFRLRRRWISFAARCLWHNDRRQPFRAVSDR